MSAMGSQITSLTIVYSTVYSDADQRKHQCSASLAFVWGIHRSPVNSPHKWPVTRKMFPFDDVVIYYHFSTGLIDNTMRRRYNTVNFVQDTRDRLLTAPPRRRDMGCLYDFKLWSLLLFNQYSIIFHILLHGTMISRHPTLCYSSWNDCVSWNIVIWYIAVYNLEGLPTTHIICPCSSWQLTTRHQTAVSDNTCRLSLAARKSTVAVLGLFHLHGNNLNPSVGK